MEELQYCPFCGGKAELKGRKKIKVICSKCGAQGSERDFRTQAIKSWNERAICLKNNEKEKRKDD